MRLKRFAELRRYSTLKERFDYLSLRGHVGDTTFGFDRYMNQQFYRSREWRSVREVVILRDNGCDLGVEGYEIHDRIIIHHMNPMTVADIETGDASILDPEFLITVTHQTHNAIHYGDERLLPQPFVDRRPGDTKLW
jgi:hypothetical protein